MEKLLYIIAFTYLRQVFFYVGKVMLVRVYHYNLQHLQGKNYQVSTVMPCSHNSRNHNSSREEMSTKRQLISASQLTGRYHQYVFLSSISFCMTKYLIQVESFLTRVYFCMSYRNNQKFLHCQRNLYFGICILYHCGGSLAIPKFLEIKKAQPV